MVEALAHTNPIWDEAIALDVDRCLVDVDVCVDTLQQAYNIEGPDYDLPDVDLKLLQGSVETTLDSFSPYSVIRSLTTGNDEAFNKVFDRFVQLGRQNDRIVYPDTRQCINFLAQQARPVYLNTRGTDFEWQRYKIAAAGLGSLPVTMTTARDKGVELAHSRVQDKQGGSRYEPQNITLGGKHFPLAARRIMGVDDYKSCLVNWPADCRALWLDRPESRNSPKQQAQANLQLPSNVSRITSLYELIDLLK